MPAGVLAACGYTSVSIPSGPDSATLAVPIFENRTFEPQLDARVTERVKLRAISVGPWRVVNRPGEADLIVRGAVTGFSVAAVAFDAVHRAVEQRLTITAEVSTHRRNRGSDAPLFTDLLTATAEYIETAEPLATRAAKNRAIDEAGDRLAEEVVARLAERLVAHPGRAP